MALRDEEAMQATGGNQAGNRGAGAECTRTSVLWADLDFGKVGHASNSLPSEQELRDILKTLPLTPSITVKSGGGFHVYWVLEEYAPVEIGTELQQRLKLWLESQGLKPENMKNISSMQRVAGTYNHKTGTPRPVEMETCTALRYTYDQLDQELPELPQAPLPTRFLGKEPYDVKGFIARHNIKVAYRKERRK
jgi:putative DNA primase/helicase